MRIAGSTKAGGQPTGRSAGGPAGVILGVLILLGGVIAGYAGQSLVAIGAPADVTVTAGVIGNSGGAGSVQPVRVRLQVGVVNSGDARVRVVGGYNDTLTSSIRGLLPSTLDVPGGTTGQLTLDLAVQCTWPSGLTLPTLRIEEPNGEEAELPVSGGSALTDACARGSAQARPVTTLAAYRTPEAKVVPKETTAVPGGSEGSGAKGSGTANNEVLADGGIGRGDRLTLELASPSGRPVEITRFQAGGVTLHQVSSNRVRSAGDGSLLAGTGATTINLAPPATCPAQWLSGGLPSAVVAELTDGATPSIAVGRLLPQWLLATACPPSPAPSGEAP